MGDNMYRYLILCLTLSLMLMTGACCSNKQAKQPKNLPLTSLDHTITATELADQNNGFAFDLFGKLHTPGKNLFLSPYSISSAMGMAYTGARGKTAAEMGKAMNFAYAPTLQHALFAASGKMTNSVNDRKIAQLYIANALFNDKSNEEYLVPEYANTLQSSFGSEVHHLDFAKVKPTTDYINSWVEKRTNERIKDIVSEDQISGNKDGLVLVNSIYFKSPWLSQFKSSNTVNDRFFTTSQKEADKFISLPLMKQTGDFAYADVPGGQIVELPFEDSDLAMIFMLPSDIDAITAKLDDKTWQSWIKALENSQKVEVILPKFRLEQTLDALPETFQAMGIKDAFDPYKADFSGILSNTVPGRIYISEIVHKAFLEVTETGTEAAAATQVGFSRLSYTPPDPDVKVFRADKPFLCMIVHKEANEILFMGKVQNPEPISE